MVQSTKLRANLNFESPELRKVGTKLKKVNGINLAQGLCIMPAPEAIFEAAHQAMNAGHNMYSLAQGVETLRVALSQRLKNFNSIDASPDRIIVTTGSTGAFESVCEALINPGDEVVTFLPFYPYHRNSLIRAGAVSRYVTLEKPDREINWTEFDRAIGSKTKFVLITTPNNPTGKMFNRKELERIAQVCIERDILCVTDEVYEYITYDDHEHVSIASLPGMASRTITISSYSKTFAITGWRIGYMLPPEDLYEPLLATFDQMFVCAPTPLQHAVSFGIENLKEEYFSWLRAEYLRKRGILASALEKAGFAIELPQGAYFILADTSKRFPGLTSEVVADQLIETAQLGAVPASDFLGPEAKGDPGRSNFLRFSFGVPDEMLLEASSRLGKL